MRAQHQKILFTGDTNQGSIFFLAWNKNEVYPLNYLLPKGVMLTISKFFTILFLISLPVGIDSSFKWVSKHILFLVKLKGGEVIFLEGEGVGGSVWDYNKEHFVTVKGLSNCPFVRFEVTPPLPYHLLDSHTNKYSRV